MIVDEYVSVYGEQYRQLINDTLCWLEVKECEYGLSIDQQAFIQDLVSNVCDYKSCALPEEVEILSLLPEDKKNLVFKLAGKQNHCQNLPQWLDYLREYVDRYIRKNK